MRFCYGILAAGMCMSFAAPAAAQYIGVLQSAETMDKGVFKLMAAPILVFGKNDADNEFGLAARAGYGFTNRFDAEAKLGLFENGTFAGADAELWILKGRQEDTDLDLSVTGGIHWMFGKDQYFDTMGFELTPALSGHLTPDFELCGALDVSFESIDDAPAGFDDSFTRVHLVPGIEYRLSDSVDFVGEVGVGLNDDSFTYAGVGFAYYVR